VANQKKSASKLLPVGQIAQRILWVRERKVILDADLAELYGTQTKRLNEQVKRNRGRFPDDFLFQLTAREKSEVVANCDHLDRLKYSPRLPYAFTEHGALMVAAVLNTPRAVDVSIYVVRAFVKLRDNWSCRLAPDACAVGELPVAADERRAGAADGYCILQTPT
jgi:hypothetical protein